MSDPDAVRRAAIDVGTVSTRLLVADVGDSVDEVVRRTVITHLGEGVAATGLISTEARDRTLATVREYRDEAREAGAGDVIVIATSAARDAENGDEFLSSLADLGLHPAIVSGSQEAHLSFLGATYSIRGDDVLVVDLGGGSTEFVLGSAAEADDGGATFEVETSRSIDVGSRRVSDLFLASDPPTSAELEEATAWVVEQVRPFFDGLRHRPTSLVAVGGTVTSLSAIRQGLDPYDPDRVHGSELTGADLADLREDLSRLPVALRRDVPGLDPARADVIVGGVLVLEALLALAGLDAMVVSEHDILYGLVLEGP